MDPIAELTEIIARLRAECAWTKQQTHASLLPYLAEETQELAQALTAQNQAEITDELGDVLLQVYLHAALADIPINDVAANLNAKLRRRNPHVFGDRPSDDPVEISRVWDEIKRQEGN